MVFFDLFFILFLTEVVFHQRPFAGILFLCNSAASRWNSWYKMIQVHHHQLNVGIWSPKTLPQTHDLQEEWGRDTIPLEDEELSFALGKDRL